MNILEKLGTILVVIIILFGIYLIYDDIRVARENNSNINSEIYPAFKKVENGCRLYDSMEIPKKCELALQLYERCSDGRSECSAEEYYEALKRFGFDLPPYYKSGYKKKYPIWKFWKR